MSESNPTPAPGVHLTAEEFAQIAKALSVGARRTHLRSSELEEKHELCHAAMVVLSAAEARAKAAKPPADHSGDAAELIADALQTLRAAYAAMGDDDHGVDEIEAFFSRHPEAIPAPEVEAKRPSADHLRDAAKMVRIPREVAEDAYPRISEYWEPKLSAAIKSALAAPQAAPSDGDLVAWLLVNQQRGDWPCIRIDRSGNCFYEPQDEYPCIVLRFDGKNIDLDEARDAAIKAWETRYNASK